jgi:exosome complex RNA-binding protein Csl4
MLRGRLVRPRQNTTPKDLTTRMASLGVVRRAASRGQSHRVAADFALDAIGVAA